jgi:hypothetical protein
MDLGYVVCNEAVEPYHPSTLATMWQAAIAARSFRSFQLPGLT